MKKEIDSNSVFIGGIEYIPKSKNIVSQNFTGPVKIVVLQRGWVYIGRFSKTADGVCSLHNAYNIHRWGTTEGLGELVNGVTNSTVLKKVEGVIEFDWLTVVNTITCDSSKYPLI